MRAHARRCAPGSAPRSRGPSASPGRAATTWWRRPRPSPRPASSMAAGLAGDRQREFGQVRSVGRSCRSPTAAAVPTRVRAAADAARDARRRSASRSQTRSVNRGSDCGRIEPLDRDPQVRGRPGGHGVEVPADLQVVGAEADRAPRRPGRPRPPRPCAIASRDVGLQPRLVGRTGAGLERQAPVDLGAQPEPACSAMRADERLVLRQVAGDPGDDPEGLASGQRVGDEHHPGAGVRARPPRPGRPRCRRSSGWSWNRAAPAPRCRRRTPAPAARFSRYWRQPGVRRERAGHEHRRRAGPRPRAIAPKASAGNGCGVAVRQVDPLPEPRRRRVVRSRATRSRLCAVERGHARRTLVLLGHRRPAARRGPRGPATTRRRNGMTSAIDSGPPKDMTTKASTSSVLTPQR